MFATMAPNLAELWTQAQVAMVTAGASPLESKLKVGILGTASIARTNTLAMKASKGVEAYAIASRSQEKADAFAKEFGLQKAYAPYEALLGDKDVQAVYIPLPTSMHKEWVHKAASAGKHILVEKPCFMTSEELVEAVEFCRAKGVVYMDGVMFMHHVRYASLLKSCWPKSGFGPNTVSSTFCFGPPQDFFKHNIRTNPKLDGLGALGDLGFYSVRLAFATFGYELPEFASAQILVELNGVPLDLDCLLLWEQEKSGDGLPFLRSSNFRCSYFELSRQDAVISSSKTAVSMDDFVIPLSTKSSALNWTNKVTWMDDGKGIVRETQKEVFGHCRQEVNMWEDFALLVSKQGSSASEVGA